MMYDKHGNRPTKGARSVDLDDAVLLAKCGQIKFHHWAHLPGYVDPDPWSEPETDWHREWKSHFHKDNTEQRFIAGGILHRMDARMYVDGVQYAIEFQHSTISVEEIQQREAGYVNMVWVFDCIGKDMPSRDVGDGTIRIWWKRPRTSVLWCNQPVLLDIGDAGVYHIISMPEYGNDFWYAKHCHKNEIIGTLTSGTFSQATKVLEKLITEGAA
jgi:hypothetical protein